MNEVVDGVLHDETDMYAFAFQASNDRERLRMSFERRGTAHDLREPRMGSIKPSVVSDESSRLTK